MKKFMGVLGVLVGGILIGGSVFAKSENTAKPNAMFTDLKGLEGNWVGTHKTEKGEEKVPVNYALSSGGSILVEKMFAGEKKEMMSVYHPAGESVLMTHYCSLGNQPRMRLSEHHGNVFQFKFQDASNIGKKDPHMHELKVTLEDDQHFSQEWSFYENGKLANTEVFHFVRKK